MCTKIFGIELVQVLLNLNSKSLTTLSLLPVIHHFKFLPNKLEFYLMYVNESYSQYNNECSRNLMKAARDSMIALL